jgi:hypothetical protein
MGGSADAIDEPRNIGIIFAHSLKAYKFRPYTMYNKFIPGGCPLPNTAIDTDDGNPVLRERARKALEGWRSYIVSVIRGGIKTREIRPRVNAKKLATLIISTCVAPHATMNSPKHINIQLKGTFRFLRAKYGSVIGIEK